MACLRLNRTSLLLSKVADPGELECLSLQGFDHEHEPDEKNGKDKHYRNQHHQKGPERGNDKQDKAHKLERDSEEDTDSPEQQALQRMKTYKPIFIVRIEEQEDDGWNEGDISQRPRNFFRQSSDLALSPASDFHGASAARTKGSSVGHLRGAMWA